MDVYFHPAGISPGDFEIDREHFGRKAAFPMAGPGSIKR